MYNDSFLPKGEGLLKQAVQSILNQDIKDTKIHIIIVDDSSPIKAKDELKNIKIEKKENFSFEIIEHSQNKGEAAARNTALDNTPDHYDYIACLDSDDEWMPSHLSTIFNHVTDFDVYFCAFKRDDWTKSVFEKEQFEFLKFNHIKISQDLFKFEGDFKKAIIEKDFIGNPTLIFRQNLSKDLRFKTELNICGTDILFLQQLLHKSKDVYFSTKTNILCHVGISYFSNNIGWGNPNTFRSIYGQYTQLIMTHNIFPNYNNIFTARRKRLRRNVVYNFFHCAANKKKMRLDYLKKIILLDPAILLSLPIFLYFYISEKIKKSHAKE